MSATAAAHRLLAPPARSGAVLDAAIAAAVLAGTVAALAHDGGIPAHPGARELDPIAVVLAACGAVPLLSWRRFPLGVFAASTAASVLLAGLSYPIDGILGTLGPAAALYLLAASRDQQAPWTPLTTATVVGLFIALLAATAAAQHAFPAAALLHTGLAWAGAWFAGDRTRLRREHIAELRARAARVQRDTDRDRLLAAAEERARIARDLHDSAGHAISVIAVRAGAARLRHQQEPDRSLAALTAIEELARQTVAEIDQIVGALREDGPPNGDIEAPPGLASLDTLIEQQVAAGLHVMLDTAGTPRPVGGAADQAAYRILQEALTNAARHGSGSARIEVAYGDTAVELSVTNPVPAGRAPRPGGGHGLVGMHERATLLGGSLEAGRANRAFRVHARIPYLGRHP